MAKRKIKNRVLKALGYINFLLFVYYACWLNADSWFPFIMVCVTGSYLCLFAYANNWFEDWRN